LFQKKITGHSYSIAKLTKDYELKYKLKEGGLNGYQYEHLLNENSIMVLHDVLSETGSIGASILMPATFLDDIPGFDTLKNYIIEEVTDAPLRLGQLIYEYSYRSYIVNWYTPSGSLTCTLGTCPPEIEKYFQQYYNNNINSKTTNEQFNNWITQKQNQWDQKQKNSFQLNGRSVCILNKNVFHDNAGIAWNYYKTCKCDFDDYQSRSKYSGAGDCGKGSSDTAKSIQMRKNKQVIDQMLRDLYCQGQSLNSLALCTFIAMNIRCVDESLVTSKFCGNLLKR